MSSDEGFKMDGIPGFIKRIFSSKLTLLFLISAFTFVRLLRPGYFSMQDDVQVFRLFEFDKCIKSLQIPCRWIPDGGAGYGYPLFNYYPPLPYIVGEATHLLGLGFIDSVKFLFVLGFLGATFSMYFLIMRLWGERSGFLGAIAYLFAPYRAVDSYVRGALSEFWALSLSPLVLLGVYMVIDEQPWGMVVLVAAFSSLILTHLLTVFMLVPLLVVWVAYWLIKTKKYRSIYGLVMGSVVSSGITAFFWAPAILEKNLVTVETMTQGFFDFHNHFASFYQLFFSRFWGYGASTWGLSVQVGLLQWLLPLAFMFFSLILLRRKLVRENLFYLLVVLGFGYAFLVHSKSTFIWSLFPSFNFIQFPWRFVGLAVMCFSVAIGAMKVKSWFLYLVIVVVLITSNVIYFKEDIWYPFMTDAQKLSASQIERQNIAGLRDYWPVFGESFPHGQVSAKPRYLSGFGVDLKSEVESNRVRYGFNSGTPSTVEIPRVYFPNWRIYEDNSNGEVPLQITQPLGLISFRVPKGDYWVTGKLEDTSVRSVANWVSMSFLFIVVGVAVKSLSVAKSGENAS